MKANPGEHCQDCVHWVRDTDKDLCEESGQDTPAGRDPCEKFEPCTLARIARGIHSIAWSLEGLRKQETAPQDDGACPTCKEKNLTLESWDTDGLGRSAWTLSCDNCGRVGEGKTENEATDDFYRVQEPKRGDPDFVDKGIGMRGGTLR